MMGPEDSKGGSTSAAGLAGARPLRTIRSVAQSHHEQVRQGWVEARGLASERQASAVSSFAKVWQTMQQQTTSGLEVPASQADEEGR